MAIVGLDLSSLTGSESRKTFEEEIGELQDKYLEYNVFEGISGKMHFDDRYDFYIKTFDFNKNKRVCDIKELFSDCEFSLQKGKYLVLTIVRNSSKVCADLRSLFPPMIRCKNTDGDTLVFYNLDLIEYFEFKDSLLNN